MNSMPWTMFPSSPTEPRPRLRSALASFRADQSGAVAVDWVVLSGAVVGLGIAVTLVVSGGLEDLTGEIQLSLAEMDAQSGFIERLQEFGQALTGFSDGTGGWSGGDVVSMDGIGDVYQVGPQSTIGGSWDLPPGTAQATVEFDLYGLDTLNNEPATITVNGQVAGIVTVDNGTATFTSVNGGTTTFEANSMSQGTDLNGNGHADTRTQVRLTVSNPGDSVSVQVSSDAHANVDNESYAIDDFRVTAN
ncbi:hypothetical protein HKCCE3408_15730 [Rhodobacterales bacterium HKCCE3408]|nr:hypothetical protein [Rhodobacterales bacterium HKCCE3408]